MGTIFQLLFGKDVGVTSEDDFVMVMQLYNFKTNLHHDADVRFKDNF